MADEHEAEADNEERGQPGRFTFELEGVIAELEFHVGNGYLVLDHTGVPKSMGGTGVGGRLVRAALDYAEDQQLTIIPDCEFARGWLERNPDEAGRVTIEWPAA